MGLRDEVEVVREVAAIFRALQPLLTKISPANPSSKICSASSDRTEAYIRSLAVMLQEFSEIQVDPQVRGKFEESATILSAVTAFLHQLRSQTKEFENFCFSDKESSTRGIRAMGEVIGSLADMAAVLGNIRAAEEIRKGSGFTETMVTQLQAMNDLNSGLDCSVTDLASAANSMEDLANIIQDVGIDNLKRQLGVDLSFDLIRSR